MMRNNNLDSIKTVFLGGPEISVDFITRLKELGVLPNLVVTTPDMPQGRKLRLTPPPLAIWAENNGIPYIQPKSLGKKFDHSILAGYDLFIVVAYGKIIPKRILDFPTHGSINLHPSLLPKYRGASPIQTAILNDDKETGYSLMLLDEQMDHGPLLLQKNSSIKEWKKNREMEKYFAHLGAESFVEVVPEFLAGKITPIPQDHSEATECGKYQKSDSELDLSNPRDAFLRYCAFEKPFFFLNDIRIIVTDASWYDDNFIINKIIPAGKKETSWEEYKTNIDKKI